MTFDVLPVTVFRITSARYTGSAAEALSGRGGVFDDGRWHSRGTPIVYTGESTSLCLLERLVHADEWIADRHPDRVMITLTIPPIPFTYYTANELNGVDPNWRDEGNATCRSLGNAWLGEGKYCGMVVPSAVDIMARNLLLNPAHPSIAAVRSANSPLILSPMNLDERVVSLAKQRRA